MVNAVPDFRCTLAKQPRTCAHPERPVFQGKNSVDDLGGKPALGGVVLPLPVPAPEDETTATQADPEGVLAVLVDGAD